MQVIFVDRFFLDVLSVFFLSKIHNRQPKSVSFLCNSLYFSNQPVTSSILYISSLKLGAHQGNVIFVRPLIVEISSIQGTSRIYPTPDLLFPHKQEGKNEYIFIYSGSQ